jgi:hypothetical protein
MSGMGLPMPLYDNVGGIGIRYQGVGREKIREEGSRGPTNQGSGNYGHQGVP